MKQITAGELTQQHVGKFIQIDLAGNAIRLGPISMVIHTKTKTTIRTGARDSSLSPNQEIKAVDFK